MTSPTQGPPAQNTVDPSSLRTLSPRECWSQLAEQHEGRLGYLSGRGERHVVSRYVLSGRSVVLRLPSYNEAPGFADGRRVALEVQRGRGPRHVALVDASGWAHVVPEVTGVPDGLPDEGWPDGLASHLVVVEVDDVQGTVRAVGPTGSEGVARSGPSRTAAAPRRGTPSTGSASGAAGRWVAGTSVDRHAAPRPVRTS